MRKFALIFLIILVAWTTHAQDTTRISLLFIGDIMQHDSNIAAAYDPINRKFDYSACFEYVAPILRSADLTIGNLELTLAGAPYKGYPQFSAPDELARELKRVGVDVLVTANNHSLDRRRKGLERTLSVLDTLQILHTGTFRDSLHRVETYPLVIEKNGFRFSLLNYTYGTNGIPVTKPNIVNLIDTVAIKADLAKARSQQTDAIIVFMHWGDEYQSLPNKTQKNLAALCFREGAKMVIGAHPHVVQPMEWRKEPDQLVVYSLGNFVSGQRPRYRDGGAMLWVKLEKIKTDSMAATSVRNAEYEFNWVSKSLDEKKEFVMYPLRYFEHDSVMIKPKLLRDAFELFKKDSRALYGKHNVNIPEKKVDVHPDSSWFAIRLGILDEQDSLLNHPVLSFYGVNAIEYETGEVAWYAGKFYDRDIARQALTEIMAIEQFKGARLVRRVDTLSTRGKNNSD